MKLITQIIADKDRKYQRNSEKSVLSAFIREIYPTPNNYISSPIFCFLIILASKYKNKEDEIQA